jgi:cytochrome b involved in lipid metabolism
MANDSNDKTRKISPEELAQHATAKDCWLLIEGIVYDVTKYLDNHPGGSAVMVEHAGQDCTSNFEDIGERSTPTRPIHSEILEGCRSYF